MTIPDQPQSIVDVDCLTKNFRSHRVLDCVSLRLELGQRLVIIGPSHSGKSTLLRCINGLETPTSGQVRVDGLVVGDPATPIGRIRAEVGKVLQQFNLFPQRPCSRT